MEKKKRSTALGAFTRNENAINVMIDEKSPTHIVTPQFEKLQACWNKLEDAHDAYIESLEDEDLNDVILNSLLSVTQPTLNLLRSRIVPSYARKS